MSTHNFTVKETFKEGWDLTLKHGWFLLCVFVAVGVIMSAVAAIPFFAMIVNTFVGVIITTLSLRIASGYTPTYKDLLTNLEEYKVVWHYFLVSLLYSVVVIVGLVAFILPGIYLATRLQFYKFIVIEHPDMGIVDIFKLSNTYSIGHFWQLFAFLILIIMLNIVGALFFGVGLLITVPLTLIANAVIYKKLANKHNTPTA